MVECEETALKLFVPHEQFAEAVEPAMANLDHPAPSLLLWGASFGIRLLTSVDDARNIAMAQDDFHRRLSSIARVGAQMLVAPVWRRLALDHNGLKHCIDLGDVVLIGSGHDERQRDATSVHQEVSLAPFFFPDLSDCGRPLLVPKVP